MRYEMAFLWRRIEILRLLLRFSSNQAKLSLRFYGNMLVCLCVPSVDVGIYTNEFRETESRIPLI